MTARARENRAFLGRAVRFLAAEAGVRQFPDFGQPVALMLVAILHFIPDEARPADIVARLLSALPAGSYLVALHGTTEHDPVGPAH